MHRQAVIDVLRTTTLGTKRLIGGPPTERCYCTIGACLKALGYDDSTLLRFRDSPPYVLWQTFGDDLAARFAMTRNDLYDLVDETDGMRDPTQLLKHLERELQRL